MSKKRAACFFTAGYTEVNSLKSFVKKINADVEYIQLCPIAERRSKRDIKNRHHVDCIKRSQNGYTGEALTEYILGFVTKRCFQEEEYDVIIIEDDKDDKFLTEENGFSVIDEAKWIKHKNQILQKLHERAVDVPVIFWYASPEVESWFVADWNNSFGKAYLKTPTKPNILTYEQNNQFSIQFKRYVYRNVLGNQYCNCIERYGYFEGAYRKLSEELQKAIVSPDFWKQLNMEDACGKITYSKRCQGEDMLRQLNPEQVLAQCNYFFKEAYWAIKHISNDTNSEHI